MNAMEERGALTDESEPSNKTKSEHLSSLLISYVSFVLLVLYMFAVYDDSFTVGS